jgi:DNA helicase-2/ATP-dependent DNA helicase PcrA
MLKYQSRFQYLLVDEYQDTNMAQYNIVKTWPRATRTSPWWATTARASTPSAERTSRTSSTSAATTGPQALQAGAELPQHQDHRGCGQFAHREEQGPDQEDHLDRQQRRREDPVHRSLSDNEEGAFVAHSIFETKMQKQVPNKGFAILYRTNAQSRSMEEALRKLNLPYRIYGGLSFYQRKEIKDLISYFRLVCNPRDEEALKRVINYPTRGIGQTTVDKLLVTATAKQMPIWDLILQHLEELDVHGGTRKAMAISCS